MSNDELHELQDKYDRAVAVLHIVGRWVAGENTAITQHAAATAYLMWRMAEEES